MNLKWLKQNTILLTAAGSRSYGTNRPDSDVDVKGVTVPPRQYRDGFLYHFEQADGKENLQQFIPDLKCEESRTIAQRDGLDGVVFSLPKFMKLAADCNPNVVEALFVDERDVLICSVYGDLLRASRKEFLSRKAVHTFSGYAASQLGRIETHRKWLLNPPTAPPARVEFGLPERTLIPADQLAAAAAEVKKVVDGWEIDFRDLDDSQVIYIQGQIQRHLADLHVGRDERFNIAARLLGFDTNFIELMERERRYKSAHNNWAQYQEWKTKRNPARAKMEAAFGYDGKHALHLVRLLRCCREILTEGTFRVRRPDATELVGLLQGVWSYEKLVGWAREQDAELHELVKSCPLPRTPNYKLLDDLCQEITQIMLG